MLRRHHRQTATVTTQADVDILCILKGKEWKMETIDANGVKCWQKKKTKSEMESAGEKLRTSAFMWFGFPILSCRISLPAFLLYLYSPHRKHKYEHYYFISRSHSFGSTNKVLLFAMLVECKMVVFCDTVVVICFSQYTQIIVAVGNEIVRMKTER